jgi:hypothetical protein
MEPMKGYIEEPSIVDEGLWEQAWEDQNCWVYYNGPILSQVQLKDGRRGILHCVDEEPGLKFRYHLYLYEDFDTVRFSLLALNEPLRETFQRASKIYGIDVCEHKDAFSILEVREMKFEDIPEDELPTVDARLHEEQGKGNG